MRKRIASQELLVQFNELLSSLTHFGLLVSISNESLKPVRLLTPPKPATAASFSSCLSLLLVPHLKNDEALYVILRRYDTSPAFIAVTYVPDYAPVRQKMLFASTRLTLVRELGIEHFRETFLVNSNSEMTADGFAKHDAHNKIEAPLTAEEKSLIIIKKAEMEVSRGSGKKEIHLSSSLSMPIASDVIEALRTFERGSTNVVLLKINPDTETVILATNTPAVAFVSILDLMTAVPTDEPRFTFYRYAHTYGGEEFNSTLFIYTCPAATSRSIKNRMMYPLMKRAVVQMAENECSIQVDKRYEIDDLSELTEQTVLDDLHPKAHVNKGFAKPKRPGR